MKKIDSNMFGPVVLTLAVLCPGILFAQAGKKAPQKPDPDQINITVELSTKGNDIAFDTVSLQVPFGKSVKISFKNQAKPDSGILHNIAILKPGSLDAVLKEFAANDYDVEKISKHPSVISITPSLEPGKDAEISLTKEMLPKPGFYPYACLIPGHADMLGMKGMLHVK